jgi:hypothetical protein
VAAAVLEVERTARAPSWPSMVPGCVVPLWSEAQRASQRVQAEQGFEPGIGGEVMAALGIDPSSRCRRTAGFRTPSM